METRMERYRIYRNEITNEGELTDKLINDSQIANNYRKQITALSPKILADLNVNTTIARLISINNNQMKESNILLSFMNLIEEKRFDNLTKEISEWSSKYNQSSVIDEKTGAIKTSWLQEDEGYLKFSVNKQKLELLDKRWMNFQSNSKDQVGQIAKLSQIEDQSSAVADLKSIHGNNKTISKYNKILYLIPSISSVVFLITMIIILAVKISEIH